MIEALVGTWTGEGTTHEGEPFTGRLVFLTVAEKHGVALSFSARGKERESEITAVAPGRKVSLTSRQGPVSATYTYTCTPDGRGTCLRLVADCRIRGPLKLLGPLLRTAIRRTDGGQLRALILKVC